MGTASGKERQVIIICGLNLFDNSEPGPKSSFTHVSATYDVLDIGVNRRLDCHGKGRRIEKRSTLDR